MTKSADAGTDADTGTGAGASADDARAWDARLGRASGLMADDPAERAVAPDRAARRTGAAARSVPPPGA
ncbi:hypothetical protein ACKI2C_08395 [Streptomyces brasiliscabiei]|uniref:hypothetical protein n=1 Tax=Streptomyces brasiliscabiei TaxID=2736302 RepID=UPI0038F73162